MKDNQPLTQRAAFDSKKFILGTGLIFSFALLQYVSALEPLKCYVETEKGNLAEGKTATAVSYDSGTPPNKTVDGSRLNDPKACYHTGRVTSTPRPWIVIDLGQNHDVSTVVVSTSRFTGHANKLYTLVGQEFDGSFSSTDSSFVVCSYAEELVFYEVRYMQCDRTLHGRYVAAYRNETSASLHFSTCEIEVYSHQVFHPELWVCIWPEIMGPNGTRNMAQKKQAYLSVPYSITSFGAELAVDGDGSQDSQKCARHSANVPVWIVVDLGRRSKVIAVAATTRSGASMADFDILVGNNDGASTAYDKTLYKVCAHVCGEQRVGRVYYTCTSTILGRHVAIQKKSQTNDLYICELEVYTTDLHVLPFPTEEPEYRGENIKKKFLFDNNDDTCINLDEQHYPRQQFTLRMAWHDGAHDSTDPYSSTRFCHSKFYANLTHGSALKSMATTGPYELEPRPLHQATNQKTLKVCSPFGSWVDQNGLLHSRFACECPSNAKECNVYLRVYAFHCSGSHLLCSVFLYD